MPPRQPRAPKAPKNDPGSPLAPSAPNGGGVALASGLPDRLEFALPNFGGFVPTNWFQPSSSSVERVTDDQYEQEAQTAHEQNNALQLMGLNLDNVQVLAHNAVKATKIGELMGQYLVGIEAIKKVGVSLRNAEFSTQNELRKGSIITEKGRQLDLKLAGEQTKTAIEQSRNDLLTDEASFYTQLRPIEQLGWQNKIQAAQLKAQQAVGGLKAA